MSVIVKGMNMPKNCCLCELKVFDDEGIDYCPFTNVMCLSIGRQDDCPLVGLPEKHGSLIDADALISDIKECIEAKYTYYEWEQMQGLELALSCVEEDAPTIFEAEGDQDENT